MKKLIQHINARWLILAVLIAPSLNTWAVTADVTLTATSNGTLTSTRLSAIRNNNGTGTQCTLSGGGSNCTGTSSAVAGCTTTASIASNTWSTGDLGVFFPISAGTHVYKLNIQSSTVNGSLDKMLCGNGTGGNGPCNVCICGSNNTNTKTSNGTCTASSGQIIPTCAGGHVISVTSNLTLTCP